MGNEFEKILNETKEKLEKLTGVSIEELAKEIGVEIPKPKREKNGKAVITITETETGFKTETQIDNMGGYVITKCITDALLDIIKEYGKKDHLENIVDMVYKNLKEGVRNE